MAKRDDVTRYVDLLLRRAVQRPDLPVTLLLRDPMPAIELEEDSLTAVYASVELKLRELCEGDLDDAGVGRFTFEADGETFVFDLTFRKGPEHSWCEVMVAPQV